MTTRTGSVPVQRIFFGYLVVVAGMLVAGCTDRDAAAPGMPNTDGTTLALVGVHVIDTRTGDVNRNQTVVVIGDRIEYVGAEPPNELLLGARVLGYEDHFVIPGLWDMHVHMRNSSDADLTAENAAWLPQYLGFGVTAVRDAGGDLQDPVMRWRDEVSRGDRLGPRIYTALRKLDGPESPYAWAGSYYIDSAADIDAALDELESLGADFVKIYDGSLAGEHYLAAIAAAERRGLRTAGHMPLTVRFEAAIAAGLDSVEHELYLAKAASALEDEVAADIAEALATDANWSFYGTLERLQSATDADKLERHFDLMIERGASLTPTLHIAAVLDGMTDVSIHENDDRLAQVPPGIRESFGERVEGLLQRSPESVARDLGVSTKNREFVAAAAAHGVTILAGSDTGAVNSYLYPGDSLHHELEALVDAGLTPLQALQGATLHAAAWLEVAERYGTVEAGKMADLVVLAANPLLDIRHSRSVVAVLHGGRYFDSNELAELRTLHP